MHAADDDRLERRERKTTPRVTQPDASPVETVDEGSFDLCTRVIVPDRGVFVVLPAPPQVEDMTVHTAYFAFWRDVVSDQVHVFARPLHDETELGWSILNLARDLDPAPVETLLAERPEWEKGVVSAESMEDDVTPWQPLTRQLLWELMGSQWTPGVGEEDGLGSVAVECDQYPQAMGGTVEFECGEVYESPQQLLDALVIASWGSGTPPPPPPPPTPPCSCPSDNNPCTTDTCASGQCRHIPIQCCGTTGACNDGNACTQNDRCNNGSVNNCPNAPSGTCCGTPVTCPTDTNPCTSDTCNPVTGCNTPTTGNWCGDDGIHCTWDYCYYGVCQSGIPMNYLFCATDNNVCTMDRCYGGQCTHPALSNGTPCTSDGDPCTTDECYQGACTNPPACPTGYTCDPETGDCEVREVCGGTTCSPGTYCCPPHIGVCCPIGLTCCGNPPGMMCCASTTCCDDGNSCTTDSCPASGCAHTPMGQGSACTDDGDPCTDDKCSADAQCLHPPKDCNDNNACTTDSCSSGNCVSEPINCDDGDACTTDSCSAGACSHAPKDCDDDDPCTTDTCDVNGVCENEPIDCDDGDACTYDYCEDGNCFHSPVTGFGTVEVRYKTFIAPQMVETPPHPDISDFFAGDSRWFAYSGGTSRTFQSTTVTLDPTDANGGPVGQPSNVIGTTLGYDNARSCTHCSGSFGDWCFMPGSTLECQLTAAPGVAGNVLTITHSRVGPNEVKVVFRVHTTNPCTLDIWGPDGPAIDATLTVHFRQFCQSGTLTPMEFRLFGTHDGFPWHEVYINQSRIYEHDPCCTEEDPDSLFGGTGEHAFEGIDFCHQQKPPLDQWRQVPGQ